MRRFPAGNFNTLARNIFDTPWHTESRSNGANFWLVMRVYTGHHHDPIGYGLGLMVTKRAHQVDGRMDGWTNASRTILLPQLSAELKITHQIIDQSK
jgi:hypothetical protein